MNVEPTDRFIYQVKSESRKGIIHVVDLIADECSCEAFVYSSPKRRCKHINACREFFLDFILKKAEEEEQSLRNKTTGWKGIAPMSEQKQEEMKVYMKRRKAFLKANPTCAWTGAPAVDIHHRRGRVGELLIDMRYWAAVSRSVHEKAHRDIAWAKSVGLIEQWNQRDPDYDVSCIECDHVFPASSMVDGEMCIDCVGKIY